MDFKNIINKIGDKEYNIYLVGDIVEDFTNYIDVYELLNTNDKDIKINFIIKTLGGDISTTLMLFSAIIESKCQTVAHVYTARSAGSIIMLACDNIKYTILSSVMIHEPQFTYNKNNLSQVKEFLKNMDTMWEKLLVIYENRFDKNIRSKLEKNKEIFYTYNDLLDVRHK